MALELEHVVVGPVRRMSPGGLAGVWAEANTRADIFDALQRREAFATSWTTLLVNSSDSELPADLPATVQERGWSSPIWSAAP